MEVETPGWSWKLGPASSASGSAYVEAEEIKVLAVVNGPKEYSVYAGADEYLRHTQATIDLTISPHSCLSQPLLSALESVLLLSRYQKSVIEVQVTVLSGAPTPSLAYCLLACSLACVDAGIEMRDTLSASTAYLTGGNLSLNRVVDQPSAWLTLGYLPNVGEAALILQEGKVSPQDFVRLLQVAEAGARKHYEMVKEGVRAAEEK